MFYEQKLLTLAQGRPLSCMRSDTVNHCQYGTLSSTKLSNRVFVQIGHLNMTIKPTEPLTIQKALCLIKDVFISAAERDIYTGDGVIIQIITKDGVKEERFPLRQD